MSRHTNIAEIERLKTMLVTLFRNLGLTHREIEMPISAPNGYWSKVMSGERDFRLEHVLEFAEATGMEPAEFFLMAYVAYTDRPLTATARKYLVQRSAGNGDPLETMAHFREAKSIGEALGLPGPGARWLAEVQKLREEVRGLRQALGGEAPDGLEALAGEPPAEAPSPQPEMPPRRKRGRPPKNALRQAP
jgi:hypothetical protein